MLPFTEDLFKRNLLEEFSKKCIKKRSRLFFRWFLKGFPKKFFSKLLESLIEFLNNGWVQWLFAKEHLKHCQEGTFNCQRNFWKKNIRNNSKVNRLFPEQTLGRSRQPIFGRTLETTFEKTSVEASELHRFLNYESNAIIFWNSVLGSLTVDKIYLQAGRIHGNTEDSFAGTFEGITR